jgi:hypothetical protein
MAENSAVSENLSDVEAVKRLEFHSSGRLIALAQMKYLDK